MKTSFKLVLINMIKVPLILFGALLLSMIYLFRQQPMVFPIPDWNYYAGCKILDKNFKVIRVISTAWLCIPRKNGGWVSSNNFNWLRVYEPDGTILWEKKGFFHHQITLEGEKSVLALGRVEKNDHGRVVLYDDVYRFNISDGTVTGYFSIYDELQKNPEKLKLFDRKVNDRGDFLLPFSTSFEKMHTNSIYPTKDGYVINDLRLASFILDKDFNFKEFVNSPQNIKIGHYHDMQILDDDRVLLFENFYPDISNAPNTTFKIYEFKDEQIFFEFPLRPEDHIPSDFSGGVQKIENMYLVGFPQVTLENEEQISFVGLISDTGQWIHKTTVPFRFQDIKLLPYKDFLSLNKIK